MKFRVLFWIEVDAVDRANAEAEALKIIKSKKLEAKLSKVEEA
jgi:hypothetical protein